MASRINNGGGYAQMGYSRRHANQESYCSNVEATQRTDTDLEKRKKEKRIRRDTARRKKNMEKRQEMAKQLEVQRRKDVLQASKQKSRYVDFVRTELVVPEKHESYQTKDAEYKVGKSYCNDQQHSDDDDSIDNNSPTKYSEDSIEEEIEQQPQPTKTFYPEDEVYSSDSDMYDSLEEDIEQPNKQSPKNNKKSKDEWNLTLMHAPGEVFESLDISMSFSQAQHLSNTIEKTTQQPTLTKLKSIVPSKIPATSDDITARPSGNNTTTGLVQPSKFFKPLGVIRKPKTSGIRPPRPSTVTSSSKRPSSVEQEIAPWGMKAKNDAKTVAQRRRRELQMTYGRVKAAPKPQRAKAPTPAQSKPSSELKPIPTNFEPSQIKLRSSSKAPSERRQEKSAMSIAEAKLLASIARLDGQLLKRKPPPPPAADSNIIQQYLDKLDMEQAKAKTLEKAVLRDPVTPPTVVEQQPPEPKLKAKTPKSKIPTRIRPRKRQEQNQSLSHVSRVRTGGIMARSSNNDSNNTKDYGNIGITAHKS